MATPIPDSLERLSPSDLIGVVRDLIGEVGRLRAENEKLSDALTKLKAEHQAAKDELARLKKLPLRPPQKPSGMDKATDGDGGRDKSPAGEASRRRRGSQLDRLTIGATVIVRAQAPAGSRHKGYEDIVVQDLNLSPQVTLYRRERWETPDGLRIIAELDPGIVGGYGPNLHRFVLALHFSGQVTCERIVALLNGMGVVISKRLHHADRRRYLHGVPHRCEQIAPGISVATVRQHGVLCDQRGGARLYERPPAPAGRHRQICRA